jgi:hypothetical protein
VGPAQHGGSGLKKQPVTLPVEHRMSAWLQANLGERFASLRDRKRTLESTKTRARFQQSSNSF